MAKIGSPKIYIAIGILLIVFVPPFAKLQELYYKNRKLEERIAALREENKRLAEESRRLQSDIAYIEKKAREKIGLVREGEIVLKEAPGPTKK